jgi:2'-5' RNA ligase
MRLFVALDLPDTILKTLDTLTGRLKPAARIQWSTIPNLHITTKFIGEWPEERLVELKSALAAVPRRGAIPIRIEGLGWFPNPHSPRVFWAGVEVSHPPRQAHQSEEETTLQRLARETDEATSALGLPKEKRDFNPHLTLARIKTPVDLASLRQALARLDSVEFGEFRAESQFLYSSKLQPSGSVYTKLAEFPLSS